MPARYAVAFAAAVTVAGSPAFTVAGSPAFAAAPSCRLVVDPRDDARVAVAVPGRPAVDILSADVATGAKDLVAVIRVASLAPDDVMRAGAWYHMAWEIDSIGQFVQLVRYSGGEQVATFDPNTTENRSSQDQFPAKVAMDEKAGTITFTVPRKANTELVRKGLRFERFQVTAELSANYLVPPYTPLHSSTTLPLGGDEATSAKTYTDRARSCVKAR